MAFRKRNIPVNRPPQENESQNERTAESTPGVRPSFLTSQPATSTGSRSLDSLLGGHGGLPLGCSLLVEESGTTDFAGAVAKYFAAEGVVQGHVVHVVGMGREWEGGLPGVVEGRRNEGGEGREKGPESGDGEGRMKIAWRYEGLGRQGERGAWQLIQSTMYFGSITRLHIIVQHLLPFLDLR